MKHFAKFQIAVLLFVLMICVRENEAQFRCGFLAFLGNDRACRASCWVQGQESGYCNNEKECICNEEDLKLSEKVSELLDGKSVVDYVREKIDTFKREVESWQIEENVKEIIPSRCSVDKDGSFCRATCHTIGRVSGTCNADFTDCACSDETVSPKQYATCLDDGICSVYCQNNGKASGICTGETGWDCQCISKNDIGQEELLALELEDDEKAEENVEFIA